MLELSTNEKLALAFAAGVDGDLTDDNKRIYMEDDNCDIDYTCTHYEPYVAPTSYEPACSGEFEFELEFLGEEVDMQKLDAEITDKLEAHYYEEHTNA